MTAAGTAARRWWPLALVVAAGAACMLAYVALTPPGETPDEYSHLGYAQIVAHGALPGSDVKEKQQPPLYYVLAAAVLRAGGGLTAVRVLSVVLGVLTVLVTAAAAWRVWPGRPLVATACAAVPALLPEAQWLFGGVTNDALAFLMGAVLTYLSIRLLQEPAGWGLAVATGAACGLALLAKETDYPLVLVTLALLASRWRASPRWIVTAAAVMFAVAGWWFVRNLVSFGAPLPPLSPLPPAPGQPAHTLLRSAGQLHTWLDLAFQSVVGYYLTASTPLGVAGHWGETFRALEVLAVLAVVVGVVAVRRNWPAWDHARRMLAISLLTMCVLAALAMLGNSILVDYQPQGRYLLVAMAPAAILVVGAFRASTSRRTLAVAVTAGVTAAVLVLAGLDTVRTLAANGWTPG